MLAYNADPKFRARFLDEIRWHQETDAVARGSYGSFGGNGEWRGCAIGCSLRSLNRMSGKGKDTKTHRRMVDELGWTIQLAYLEDQLFENLPVELSLAWPLRFSSAIRAGADLSLVWARFSIWLLVDETDGVIRFARTDRSREAIRGVASLFERQCRGETVERAEWQRARSAAYAAAAAADAYAYAAYAADAYAYAADAADAAYAADAHAYAAAAYAYAAAYAPYAAAAARTKVFVRQADKLIELLEAA